MPAAAAPPEPDPRAARGAEMDSALPNDSRGAEMDSAPALKPHRAWAGLMNWSPWKWWAEMPEISEEDPLEWGVSIPPSLGA